MLKRRKQVKGFLSTSFPDLDHVLHGGFPSGTITEIAGPSGCGKTQFCLTLAVLATLPVSNGGCGGTVLFIDTEGAFSAERLVEIARCRLPELFKDDDSLHQLVSNVYIDLIQTCKNLMNRLKNLEEDLISKNVRLLIVDSVASLVRKEFGSLQDGMMRRTDFLTAEAGLLKHIAETFSIPVRCFLNHFLLLVSIFQWMDGEDTYMTAALGNTWSHCVNTRLILQFLPERRRQMLVAKSPVAPFTCFDIIIKDEGVLQDVRPYCISHHHRPSAALASSDVEFHVVARLDQFPISKVENGFLFGDGCCLELGAFWLTLAKTLYVPVTISLSLTHNYNNNNDDV
ncbi:hypothetical protein C0Q70_13388 [Pomacea canaliculata]|uniref:RecA family profile 1 domain-containing protein n=1 Tax=Pomacea canaliculata TaxID=400727 RepID=A0A2T7NX33_POMCA|nr:hypothetical protein C0Q70_13388 [Pomacea canaliculata]